MRPLDGDGDLLDADVLVALAADGMWLAPPPELVEEVVAVARLDGRVVRGSPSWARRAGTFLAGAAAAVVVAVLLVPVVEREEAAGSELVLTGTSLAPSASAVATAHDTPAGVAIELEVKDLAPAPDDFYYQAWLNGPAGSVAVGTFHLRSGDEVIELWSGVPVADYPELAVTLEPEDGDATSSRRRVLAGSL